MTNKQLTPADCYQVDIYFSRTGRDPLKDEKARLSIENVLKKYAPTVKKEEGLVPHYLLGCCYVWIGVPKGMKREELHAHLVKIKTGFEEAGIAVDNFGYIR